MNKALLTFLTLTLLFNQGNIKLIGNNPATYTIKIPDSISSNENSFKIEVKGQIENNAYIEITLPKTISIQKDDDFKVISFMPSQLNIYADNIDNDYSSFSVEIDSETQDIDFTVPMTISYKRSI